VCITNFSVNSTLIGFEVNTNYFTDSLTTFVQDIIIQGCREITVRSIPLHCHPIASARHSRQ